MLTRLNALTPDVPIEDSMSHPPDLPPTSLDFFAFLPFAKLTILSLQFSKFLFFPMLDPDIFVRVTQKYILSPSLIFHLSYLLHKLIFLSSSVITRPDFSDFFE